MGSWILSVLLLGGPAEAGATGESDDAKAQAESLYTRGRAKYETYDYDGAIELWTEAFAALPYAAQYVEIRAALVFNISAAQIEAYKLEPKPVRLEQAKRLLHRYLETIDELYEGDSANEERSRANARLDEIEALLADAGEPQGTAATSAPNDSGGPGDDGRDKPKAGRPLIIAGAAVTVVGVGMLGGMGAGLAIGNRAESDLATFETIDQEDERIAALQRGKNGNTIAIALGVSGGVVVAGGVAMLAIGLVKAKKAKNPKNASARVGGWAAPGSAGITVTGRF